jgi:Protein kinase domain
MTSPSPNSSINSGVLGAASELAQGRYVVIGSLGAGAQGETLHCVDKSVGQSVAVKRFVIRGARSWKEVELAEREALVLSALRHPSLPRYIEHFEEDGALYLVMERVEGETLAARRKRGARLDRAQVLRFLKEAAECLRYLHSQAPPVVHRDIKPGNVIIRPDGSFCLVDFGSVRDRLKPEGGSTVVGTFGFMAPEQFQGRAAPASDVYAVGATALSLMTGEEPEDLPHRGLAIDVDAALQGHPDRRLGAALRSMLEPDPDRRAPSVERALAAAGLYDHAPSAAPGDSTAVPRAQQEVRGNRRRVAEPSWHESEHRRPDDERKSTRRARKAERKAEREARRSDWRTRGERRAVVIGLIVLIALRVASVATFALFQLLLPALFSTLSLVAGRRMHQRARRMSDLGRAGQRGLSRASHYVAHRLLGADAPERRQDLPADPTHDSGPAQRTRVAEPDAADSRHGARDWRGDVERELEAELKSVFDPDHRRRR